ncbi:MAG: ABC transporter substrate-binding protein [Pseudomonadota bacterium]
MMNENNIQKNLIVFLLLTGLFSGCTSEDGQKANEQSLEKIVLMTDWYPQAEHGGFYQALAKGFYEEEGLDVEIRSGANLQDIRPIVALGQVDFAIGTTDTTIIGIGRGVPLVGMFPYFQRDPQCIMFHPNNDIETLYDLKDREVMLQASLSYTEYMVKSLGITMNLIPVDYSIARFATDENFIQQCFVTSEPVHLRKQGIETEVIMLSESGFSPYRHIYTSKATLGNKREEAAAFTRASIKGWYDFMYSDPQPGMDLIYKENPQQSEEKMLKSIAEMKKYNIFSGDISNGDVAGLYDAARLQNEVDQLNALGSLDFPVAMEDSFDLGLIKPSEIDALQVQE